MLGDVAENPMLSRLKKSCRYQEMVTHIVYVHPSNTALIKTKKYTALIINCRTGRERTVQFGAAGMSDYTIHKDVGRRRNYLRRHGGGKQDWTKGGIHTAGFWSRHLLWSRPSLQQAIRYMERKFRIDIRRRRPVEGARWH